MPKTTNTPTMQDWYSFAATMTNLGAASGYRTAGISSLYGIAQQLDIDLPDSLIERLTEVRKAYDTFGAFKHATWDPISFDDLTSPKAEDNLTMVVAARVNREEAHRLNTEVSSAIAAEFSRATYEALPYFYNTIAELADKHSELREYMFIDATDLPEKLRITAQTWHLLANLHTSCRKVEDGDSIEYGHVLAFIDWPEDEWIRFCEYRKKDHHRTDPWRWAHENNLPIAVTQSYDETAQRSARLIKAWDDLEESRQTPTARMIRQGARVNSLR